MTVNSLISAQKSADTGLQVALHPLPILEISDYITRSYQRGYKGAIVGALLGQQNGREITIEHSFTCRTEKNAAGFYKLDETWFQSRIEQMRLVHKSPPLDLVGWYALVPKSGPNELHLPIHEQLIKNYNESSILLGFHVDGILHPVAGDPLPLSIYESNMEIDDSDASGEDKEMRDSEAPTKMVTKFRQLPYTTETGEAEMIAMQFIREGGANATATATASEKRILEQFDQKVPVDEGKGKRRAVETTTNTSTAPSSTSKTATTNIDANLTKAESEYMSALQAKCNAVKMMKSRVDLVVAYLQKLPPTFAEGKQSLSDAADEARASGGRYTTPSNNILRQIQALATNINLATPGQKTNLQKEILQESNDVHLIELIADLLTSVSDVREVGKKFAVVESARIHRSRHHVGGGGGGGPGSGGGQFEAFSAELERRESELV
ncbi:hypothetical protein B0T19DRAFT_477472 [Cercophora scortea]|uniref:COP9 signalosome complex subunit 6 n=1 Tax=Cercophora scortea TaxID=314031 RepID=A0AAE0IGB0_9PEZI|nr:hypothetical protein B0T19DRAFT_477472 [Cercophora scortea]